MESWSPLCVSQILFKSSILWRLPQNVMDSPEASEATSGLRREAKFVVFSGLCPYGII